MSHTGPMRLYEVLDVAKDWGCSPATVQREADEGKLAVAADTPRGQRLFAPEEVQRRKAEREAQRARREAA